jgi:hypothetical protein
MSEAFDLNQYDKGICTMCKCLQILTQSLHSNEDVKISGASYGSIPQYIPVKQDSQYIEAFLRKRNDTEKGLTKGNSQILQA